MEKEETKKEKTKTEVTAPAVTSTKTGENAGAVLTKRSPSPVETFSKMKTPKSAVKKRPDGYKYVEENYLRGLLNRYFPKSWSWKGHDSVPINEVHGWIVVTGHLIVRWPDTGETQFFYGTGAARIQYKANTERVDENIIGMDNVVKAANTSAFKVAVNRLLNFADDVFKKNLPEEITLEDIEDFIEFANNIKNNTSNKELAGKIDKTINWLNNRITSGDIIYRKDLENLRERIELSVSISTNTNISNAGAGTES